ncbi:hypothetical protein [Pelosinus baikalensis]|uniref:Uncharacterized protein n=1 Tax=Pelosinus baikalensis TaxID=2892015 RepID=A0ABS8HVL6_9FIRM|nr:hypothetical protein [Pelosinus baikalensis]MCC5467208.1 hypothetical protein [Pelosinus baikalensis]
MRQMVMVSDQTINEALRLGTSMDAIELMIPILKKYGIANIDVSLGYLPNDGVSIEKVRRLASVQKRPLSDLELHQLYFTLAGIGERAGNASLEEVVASLEKFYGYHCGIEASHLGSLADLVAKASNRPLFPYRPVVGSVCRMTM